MGTRKLRSTVGVFLALGSCGADPAPYAVTVRVRAPATDDTSCAGIDTGSGLDAGSASSPFSLARIYRQGERCVVFAAAGFEPLDLGLHAVAVRTQEITAPQAGVEPCMGAQGSVLMAGLEARAEYQLELAIFDAGDFDAQETIPPRPRIVSRQNYRYTDDPSTGVVCLGAFSCAAVYEQVTLRARSLCQSARVLPRCSMDIPFGGRCSLSR